MVAAFDGAVLCGGQSRRMGRDKALVEIGGIAMATRVADALRTAGASSVMAVGGRPEVVEALGLPHTADAWPGEGPLGALVTALGSVGSEAVVAVLGCDLVNPSAASVEALVVRLEQGAADAVVPRVGGSPQWMHAVWRRRVAGVLADVFAAGERSIFGAVGGLDVDFVDARDATPYLDADVPGDLPDDG